MSASNSRTTFANHDEIASIQAEQKAEAAGEVVDAVELEETRQQLEYPIADGGDAEAAAADAVERTDDMDVDEADEAPGYTMTDDRRIGSMAMAVDGEGTVGFGKPSGRASVEMLAPIQEMEEGSASLTDLTGFLWHTLASWSEDDDLDADYWADNHALMDTVKLTRQLAFGGNL